MATAIDLPLFDAPAMPDGMDPEDRGAARDQIRDVLRVDVPMGGDNGVAPYLAAVWPDGSHCTMDELWMPCGDCGGAEFEVIFRRVAMPGDAKDGEPVWRESYAAICPRCMPLRPDGKNLFGRAEQRTILGWIDKAAGKFIPAEGEGGVG